MMNCYTSLLFVLASTGFIIAAEGVTMLTTRSPPNDGRGATVTLRCGLGTGNTNDVVWQYTPSDSQSTVILYKDGASIPPYGMMYEVTRTMPSQSTLVILGNSLRVNFCGVYTCIENNGDGPGQASTPVNLVVQDRVYCTSNATTAMPDDTIAYSCRLKYCGTITTAFRNNDNFLDIHKGAAYDFPLENVHDHNNNITVKAKEVIDGNIKCAIRADDYLGVWDASCPRVSSAVTTDGKSHATTAMASRVGIIVASLLAVMAFRQHRL